MGLDLLLNNLASKTGPSAVENSPGTGMVKPVAPADAGDVAEFQRCMAQGIAPVEAAESRGITQPVTLGERLTPVEKTGESGHTREWLDSIVETLQKDEISHGDLYRVQTLAAMAQVEVTRNSSVTQSMDSGLKTLLKNT